LRKPGDNIDKIILLESAKTLVLVSLAYYIVIYRTVVLGTNYTI